FRGKGVAPAFVEGVLTPQAGATPFPLRIAGARRARLRGGCRLGVGGGLGVGGLGGVAGEVALAVLLEVGFVPAAAGEAEAGGGDLALDRGLAAGGAGVGIGVGELLQPVELVAAGVAGEGIDRHARYSGAPGATFKVSAMHERSSLSLLAALLIRLGLLGAGWFAAQGMARLKTQDRYVIVKGS